MTALEVRGLQVSYSVQVVLENVAFALPAGQLVGIIGPNGAGKTTMLKAILGLVPAQAGTVATGGAAITRHGGRVAYVPQRDAINWRFPASVADVVLLVRRFPLVMLVGAIQGVLGVVAGLYLSFYLDIVSGATIVLVLTSMFFLALVFAPRRGRAHRALARPAN